jgi:hypothetical protein
MFRNERFVYIIVFLQQLFIIFGKEYGKHGISGIQKQILKLRMLKKSDNKMGILKRTAVTFFSVSHPLH